MEIKRYQVPQRLFFTVAIAGFAAFGTELDWYEILPISVTVFLMTFLLHGPLPKGRG